MDFLAPGGEIRCLWDDIQSLEESLKEEGLQHGIRASTYYEGMNGDRYDEHPAPVLANIDDSLSKDVVLSNGWGKRTISKEQLYDLFYDPNEENNLAGDEAYAEVLQKLRNRLRVWMEETEDPLLHGPVHSPAAAEINAPDQVSPSDPTYVA